MLPTEDIKRKIRISSPEEFELFITNDSGQYESIFLDKYLADIEESLAKKHVRKAIFMAYEVSATCKWSKEAALHSILAAANPIEDIQWFKDGEYLRFVVRRAFP